MVGSFCVRGEKRAGCQDEEKLVPAKPKKERSVRAWLKPQLIFFKRLRYFRWNSGKHCCLTAKKVLGLNPPAG